MDSKGIIYTKKKIGRLNIFNTKNKLDNIKSDYFIRKIFDNIQTRKSLEIVKYNIRIQKRINININNYKEFSELYSSIEVEIIPMKNKATNFIMIKEEDRKYFHIYFDDNKEEVKRKYYSELNDRDEVSKIKIIIDYQVKSFQDLFKYCKFVESINFKKFIRNNITDMSGMFFGSSFKEINLSNFNTDNVTNMSLMFYNCSSLKELNLSKFNTNKVTNMYCMFNGCSSLKELNLSNFNTNNVKNMSEMFSFCSDELKSKIRSKYKNFNETAFYE